jgi:hypothetical protein
MELCLNAHAYCADGPCGRLTYIILKSSNQTATHLVIKPQDAPSKEVPVPVQWMEMSDAASIQLRCTRQEMGRLPPFIEIHWPRPRVHRPAPLLDAHLIQKLLMRPLVCFEGRMRLQADEIPLHRDIRIVTDEGQTGRLRGLVIDPLDHRVVCLVLRSGARWNARLVRVRFAQVAHIGRCAIGPRQTPIGSGEEGEIRQK